MLLLSRLPGRVYPTPSFNQFLNLRFWVKHPRIPSLMQQSLSVCHVSGIVIDAESEAHTVLVPMGFTVYRKADPAK